MAKKAVLAFSGGLDTSFCVAWLKEQGYDVITYFVDAAATTASDAAAVEARAYELGAAKHVNVDAGQKLWDEIVIPLVWASAWRQNQYPLLCSDRYLIVKEGLALAAQEKADVIAHGCTGMGNDQVRFDMSIRALSALPIVAPVRIIQDEVARVRDFEIEYLNARGFKVDAKTKRYTINANLLGTTFSGQEIDKWGRPSDDAAELVAPRNAWPDTSLTVELTFEQGRAVALNGAQVPGPDILRHLNKAFGAYGVGRGTYAGDTIVGLKGRIVFEAPGLVALAAAYGALAEAVSTREQNSFKSVVARKWSDLVFEGGYFDPVRDDIEAYLASAQRRVSGKVQIETNGGAAVAVSVMSPHVLEREGAVYAQASDWRGIEAEGFAKLLGQSAALWRSVAGSVGASGD